MDSVVRWMGGRCRPVRVATVVGFACSVASCGSVMNMMPDPGNFRLPDRSTFLPSTSTNFAFPISPTTQVSPADLVNGQGQCAGASPAAADGSQASPRGVSLDMTECDVVRALGTPQTVDFGSQPGEQRRVILTYKTGERAGIYEFTAGRLSGVERGEEPPAVAKKPPAKKSKPSA